MGREDLRPVRDYEVGPLTTAKELLEALSESGGFQAVNLAAGARIMADMFRDPSITIFLSFTANLVATGLRGVIRQMIAEGLVDVIVTTAGSIDHDLIRCWSDYYHGSFLEDDARLRREGMARVGNVIVPMGGFIELERRMQKALEDLYSEKKRWGCRELLHRLGEILGDEGSFLYWASRRGVPVYVPGIVDGAVGLQLTLFRERREDFEVDVLKDQKELSDIVYGSRKTGAIVLGGGIAKHHTIAWNLLRGGLDYAVYVTTAPEYDGSLSGARDREAVSWGKISERAERITVVADATIAFPLMLSAALAWSGGRVRS